MFFRDLKHKSGTTLDVQLADVHLPVRLGHRDAYKLFAAPLKDQLAAAGFGTVLDCRQRTRPSGLVKGVDIYLGLTSTSADTLMTITKMLELLSAPCGSSIRLSEGVADPILFGRTEGMELSISTEVAPDAEARRDLAMTCRNVIEDIGVSRGWTAVEDRTQFYFYGENYGVMKNRVERILRDHPRYGNAMLRRVA